ncbi:protein translocase subunit SecD [Streptomyces sp. XD-27]|uniref:protein translocase subunit SecD n=1 Tax=Streptomyces sp. XD-27 TaxID=3062779 RepID=UPI0026F41D45|nr:protein translocase subunit SecD [Streptomyces sp. XD-27]WKX73431.1 protein translocase subunit SecD [Streptomyces sp. XD-27]
MAAPKKGRRSPGTQGRPGRTLVLILIAIVALTAGMFASGETTPRLGIDLAGGTSFTLQAKNQPGKPNAINSKNLNTAVNVIDRRVNGLGVSEAEVQTQGTKHIIVNIPKGTDAKQARQQVGTTAQLFFRSVITSAPGTPTPEPGDTGKKDQGKDKQGDAGDKADQGDKTKPSGTPSPTATTQGRPVSDALKADDAPKPKATEKPDAQKSGSKKPAEDDPTKQFAALDCRTPKARAAASEKAAAAKEDATIAACGEKGQKHLLGPVELAGTEVSKAKAAYVPQQGGWLVELEFTDKGGKRFGKITEDLSKKAAQGQNNQFAIVLDGQVFSAPTVDSPIRNGSAVIQGSFTQSSADSLANVLSFGALPLSFDIVDEQTVSAALGSEQLRAGLIAGAIGLALVVIYLLVYYRGLSLVALASLAVSAALTYTIMTLLGPGIGFALNLPAVCGAIVAIGITADSFIVYFERIRDEIREGRTLRPAVERGWPRARRTILVSDFVSFLAAAVLFVVTVGKVQGFAFTLGLTTLLDVVVVFFFTKPLMTILAKKKFFASGHPWSGLDPQRLGAKPPLRRSRRTPAAPADPKEA